MSGYLLIAALWGFNFFGFNNFGPGSGTVNTTYYLLLAGSTDNLTTPTGEPLEIIH